MSIAKFTLLYIIARYKALNIHLFCKDFHFFSGTHTTFWTPANYTHQFVWLTLVGDNHFIFKVKSCSEAYIALTKIPYNTPVSSYEIALGLQGNTVSELRHHVGPTEVKATAQISALDCSTYKEFWISWDKGHIKCGHGATVDQNQFLYWADPYPHDVNSLSLASGSEATWEILHPHGKIKTPCFCNFQNPKRSHMSSAQLFFDYFFLITRS